MMRPNTSDASKSRIVVITTGGTIAQKFDENQNGCVPAINGNNLLNMMGCEISSVEIELVEFSMIDSKDVDLLFLFDISKLIQKKVNDQNVDGIVVTHGTDTMEITAYFLYRTVKSHNKPIVLTGAMRVPDHVDYDGNTNFINAIKQASNSESKKYGYGVSINFAGKIHSPVNVCKEDSKQLDAFSSGRDSLLGEMTESGINWIDKPKQSNVIPLPRRLESILSVPIIYAFPGATVNFLDGLTNFKALIIVAYGCGNVNETMYFAIKRAIEKNIKIVLVTNCKYGGVYSEYGGRGGNQSLRDLNVIMAGDLNPYQAMVVASLVFSNEYVDGSKIPLYFSNKVDLNLNQHPGHCFCHDS